MERVVKTYCSICERTCGMQVTSTDNRVVKVEGLKQHVKSKGDLCVKGKAALDIMYAPDRLQHPMKKEMVPGNKLTGRRPSTYFQKTLAR